MHCPETDSLIEVLSALEGNTEKVLAHALGCDSCLAALRTVAAVRSTVERNEEVRPGFVQEVLGKLPLPAVPPQSRGKGRPIVRAGWLVVEPLLAGATALVATAAAGTAAPVPLGPTAILLAVGAGVLITTGPRALQTLKEHHAQG